MYYFVIHICEVRLCCFSRLLVHQQRQIPLDLYQLAGVSTLFAYDNIVLCQKISIPPSWKGFTPCPLPLWIL